METRLQNPGHRLRVNVDCMFTPLGNAVPCLIIPHSWVIVGLVNDSRRQGFSISVEAVDKWAAFVLCVSLQKREGRVLPVITAPRPLLILWPVHVERSLISPN